MVTKAASRFFLLTLSSCVAACGGIVVFEEPSGGGGSTSTTIGTAGDGGDGGVGANGGNSNTGGAGGGPNVPAFCKGLTWDLDAPVALSEFVGTDHRFAFAVKGGAVALVSVQKSSFAEWDLFTTEISDPFGGSVAVGQPQPRGPLPDSPAFKTRPFVFTPAGAKEYRVFLGPDGDNGAIANLLAPGPAEIGNVPFLKSIAVTEFGQEAWLFRDPEESWVSLQGDVVAFVPEGCTATELDAGPGESVIMRTNPCGELGTESWLVDAFGLTPMSLPASQPVQLGPKGLVTFDQADTGIFNVESDGSLTPWITSPLFGQMVFPIASPLADGIAIVSLYSSNSTELFLHVFDSAGAVVVSEPLPAYFPVGVPYAVYADTNSGTVFVAYGEQGVGTLRVARARCE